MREKDKRSERQDEKDRRRGEIICESERNSEKREKR